MPLPKHKPLSGAVVILTFKGHAQGNLGVWSGKSWFIWRKTNAGMTGEPNNWHICEDSMIKAWSEIPPGLLATLADMDGSPAQPLNLVVLNTAEPWRPAMEACPATRKLLEAHDRKTKPLRGTVSIIVELEKRQSRRSIAPVSPRGLGKIGNSTVGSRARAAKRNNPGFRRA